METIAMNMIQKIQQRELALDEVYLRVRGRGGAMTIALALALALTLTLALVLALALALGWTSPMGRKIPVTEESSLNTWTSVTSDLGMVPNISLSTKASLPKSLVRSA